jgi:FixJ family two-component response regulator
MSVFVVDDDADTRRFITWLLTSKTRHQVVGFPTAEAALEELHHVSPSVFPASRERSWPGRRLVLPIRLASS